MTAVAYMVCLTQENLPEFQPICTMDRAKVVAMFGSYAARPEFTADGTMVEETVKENAALLAALDRIAAGDASYYYGLSRIYGGFALVRVEVYEGDAHAATT